MIARSFAIGILWAGAALWALGQTTCVHSAPAHTARYRVACPDILPPGLVPTRTEADGWAMAAPQQWPADGSGMLHGAHDGQAYLVPGTSEHKTLGGAEGAYPTVVLR